MRHCLKRLLKITASTVFWLTVWQAFAAAAGSTLLFPSPVTTLARLFELIPKAQFWFSAGMTLLRIAGGFSLAVVVGTALAVLCAVSGFAEELLRPVRNVIKSVPVASVILLVLLWFNADIVPLFISFLMVLPVIWANVYAGISSVDPDLLEMARVFRFGPRKTLKLVYLPSMTPILTAACTTGFGFAWKAGISAEVLSHPVFSIGTRIYESKISLETEDLFAWTLVIVLLSLLLEKIAVRLLKIRGGKKEASL